MAPEISSEILNNIRSLRYFMNWLKYWKGKYKTEITHVSLEPTSTVCEGLINIVYFEDCVQWIDLVCDKCNSKIQILYEDIGLVDIVGY